MLKVFTMLQLAKPSGKGLKIFKEVVGVAKTALHLFGSHNYMLKEGVVLVMVGKILETKTTCDKEYDTNV